MAAIVANRMLLSSFLKGIMSPPSLASKGPAGTPLFQQCVLECGGGKAEAKMNDGQTCVLHAVLPSVKVERKGNIVLIDIDMVLEMLKSFPKDAEVRMEDNGKRMILSGGTINADFATFDPEQVETNISGLDGEGKPYRDGIDLLSTTPKYGPVGFVGSGRMDIDGLKRIEHEAKKLVGREDVSVRIAGDEMVVKIERSNAKVCLERKFPVDWDEKAAFEGDLGRGFFHALNNLKGETEFFIAESGFLMLRNANLGYMIQPLAGAE